MRSFLLGYAYILHSRPYRDTSLILDVFMREHGRINLIAKGARNYRPRSHAKGLLQPFLPLLISYRGKTDLMNLTNVELANTLPSLNGTNVFYGFYLNELLTRFLQREDPHPILFRLYEDTLQSLAENPIRALRLFEKKILSELGYGLRLHKDTFSGEAITPTCYYDFNPAQGLTRIDKKEGSFKKPFRGDVILALHHENFTCDLYLKEAKRLLQSAITHWLEGRPLRSQELLLEHPWVD